jgi:sugar phosphate isomerase/epimerase
MRLGISSYTYVWAVGVPGYPQPARPLTAEGLLHKAASVGVSVLQVADNLPLERLAAPELNELAMLARQQEIALELGTAGVMPEHLLRLLKVASILRSRMLRVVIDTDRSQPSLDEAADWLLSVLPQFAAAGVTIAIENHDRFRADELARLIQRCNSPFVGICLDTANSLGCGEDIETVLASLGRWVVNVHIKDFSARRLPHRKGFLIEGCPAGEGLVNIPRLLGELRRLGRDPNVILELWPPPENTIEASIAMEDAWARQSITYLRPLVE